MKEKAVAVWIACLLCFAAGPGLAERPASFHEDVEKLIAHQEPVILLENVRVVDGTGAAVIEGAAVLIRDGRIAAIGETGTIEAGDAMVIDGNDQTLLPGYVMLHEHLIYLDPANSPQSYTSEHLPMPPLYLAAGTTTLRTTGTVNANDDLRTKALIDEGRVAGPNLFVTGPFLEGPGSYAYQMRPIMGPDDARLFVRYWVNAGATSFKAYMNVSREVLGAAIDEAHTLGVPVTGHLCSVTFEEAAALGIDDLEHGLTVASDVVEDKQPDVCPEIDLEDRIRLMDLDNPVVQSVIETLVENDVAITSTLPVFAAGVHPAIPTQASLDLLSPRSRQMAESRWISLLQPAGAERADRMRRYLAREMAFEKAFVDAGGTLLVGTDPTGWGGTLPPNSTHAALMLLVQAGFTPLQTLSMATLGGAKFLGVADEVGSIEVGKRADLVLVKGEPDEDIASVQNVTLVFRDGVAYDPAKLVDSVRGTVGR